MANSTTQSAAVTTEIAPPLTSRRTLRPNALPLHAMMIAAVLLLFVYSYLPMFGVVMAFQRFNIFLGFKGFWQSQWVGLENYARVLSRPPAVRALINTVVIAFWKILIGFITPVTVAILLNEIRKSWLKRTIQTIVYIPHFVSWVILGGIIRALLLSDGPVNQLIALLGSQPIPFLQSNQWFVPTLIVTNVWKEFGFGTIVYLAAISGIDPTLYEAAIVDGATRGQQTWHVTLPGMRMIIVLTLVLSLQNVLNAGFDQVFNLYNVQVYETGDIIDTYVFRLTFESTSPQYSIGAAIGLLKSFVSLMFISLSYWLAVRFANYRIF